MARRAILAAATEASLASATSVSATSSVTTRRSVNSVLATALPRR